MTKKTICALCVGLAAAIPVAPPSHANPDPTCIKVINVDENMLSVYMVRYRDNKCKLLGIAAATRTAMLEFLHSRPNNCGFPASTLSILEAQKVKFSNDAAACAGGPARSPTFTRMKLGTQ